MLRGVLLVGGVALAVAIGGCALVTEKLNLDRVPHVQQVSEFGDIKLCDNYAFIVEGIATVYRDKLKESKERAMLRDLNRIHRDMNGNVPNDLQAIVEDAYFFIWDNPDLTPKELNMGYVSRCQRMLGTRV